MPADYKSAAAGLSVSSPSSDDNHHDPASKTLSAAAAAAQLGGMDPSSSPAAAAADDRSNLPFRDDDDDNDDNDDDVDLHDAPPVPWVRGRGNTTTSSASAASRRLSTPYALHGRRASSAGASPQDLRGQVVSLGAKSFKAAHNLYSRSATIFAALSPTQQFLVLAGSVVLVALTITLLVFSHKAWMLLGPVAASWRAMPGGWLILWVLIFFVAFPPLIGYSTLCTVAGFVWGFPLGWPIAASATVAGSAAAFLASRTVFSSYVDRLVGSDARFVALGQVLRRDGIGVLALMRFCPLPYSPSNGFLATIPSIQPASFALATALASPKLLVHIFIGSRLALLAEAGDTMSFGDRVVNYLSMGVGATVGAGVGYVIYRRTMARAAELARADAAGGRPLEDGRGGGGRRTGGGGGGYADEDDEGAHLMDPNDAAALMVDDDDISLWDANGDDDDDFVDGEETASSRYRDEEEAIGGAGKGTSGQQR